MLRRHAVATVLVCAGLGVITSCSCSGDWPTYKADPARSGVTSETLSFPLAAKWIYRPSQGPMPAWPEPGKELHRMDFDYAFQPVGAEGRIYFASSADDTLRALDAETGRLLWRFTAGGPIRFAPTISAGNVYVAADDGQVHCLRAESGEVVWRLDAASADDRLLGNGRMISRWPCRTDVLVADGVAYCAAGMWPTEGVCIYALDAETGEELWCNDSSGAIYVDLPHPGAWGFDGVTPQGYLVLQGETLLVPTGRCVPAAFSRRTGRLLYYKPGDALYHGGAWVTATEGLYFNPRNRFQNPSQAHVGEAQPVGGEGMFAYSFASGDVDFALNGKYRVLVNSDTLYVVGAGALDALDLTALREKRRVTPDSVKWSVPYTNRVYTLAMAGDVLLAGNDGAIQGIDAVSGRLEWQADLDGQVRGLAVSDGRLIVSTHDGAVLCFEPGHEGDAPADEIAEEANPWTRDADRATARHILAQSGKSQGYALVVGEPDSRLAEALATESELHVISVLPIASDLQAERDRLVGTGVYGSRVWVDLAGRQAALPYGPYFADLVVVSAAGDGMVAPGECYRVLRPCGGAMCFPNSSAEEVARFLTDASITEEGWSDESRLVVRGPLEGQGEWRYPWADGGRSGVGRDRLVRLPFEVLWFGGPGPDRLMDRHLMTSPPVSANGRVFMTGQHHVIAFDAYNGRELWSRGIAKVGRKYSQYYSSSLVADDGSVYVVDRDRCRRLDQATGETVSVYEIPQSVVEDTPPPVVPVYADVTWPEVWQAIGPFPEGAPPLPVDELANVPDRVVVREREYVAAPLPVVGGTLDFTRLFGGYGFEPLGPGEESVPAPRRTRSPDLAAAGQIAYAFATIDCPEPGTLLIGAGADWWMDWYLDGRPVFDTLDGGNEPPRHNWFSPQPCSPTDHLFEVDVSAGKHVLAVVVKSGSKGWALASGSMGAQAEDLRPVVSDDENLPDLLNMIWGYLSVADDLVLGSCNVPIAAGQPAEAHLVRRSESSALFALDEADGSLRWVYRPAPDHTISNIDIAFGDGRLFLLDATSKVDTIRARRRGEEVAAGISLVALELATGDELWRQEDVPLLGDRSMPTRIKSNPTHLFMGLPNWGHLVYANGVVVLGANAAYNAATGEKLWATDVRPQKLPIVSGDWLIAQPYAYGLRDGQQRETTDPLTGQRVPWRFTRAYGCGPVNGCENLLFFRSGADGFFDMNLGGTANFGAVRAGCARTLVAAHGLLIHPEGYSGCCCSYNYQTSLALAPAADWRDTWYVFPQVWGAQAIERLAVNFGAPGDRRLADGTTWLSFPSPMAAGAASPPVSVSLRRATCYRKRRAEASIRDTDVPWIYSSGLSGSGQIAVGVELRPQVFVPAPETPPTIDGKLDDPCWRQAEPIPFGNTPFTMLGAGVELRVLRDHDNLYFACYRMPLADAPAADEQTFGKTDALEIYITDRRKRLGAHFGLKRGGAAFATFGTVDRYRKVDPAWQGDWQHAVRDNGDEWAAEASVPLAALADSGVDVANLQLNCMSQSLTGSGLESIFLTDPVYSADLKRCIGFRALATEAPESPTTRFFTVRLHFAEVQGARPGERVFNVALQGRSVLVGLDVVRDAGGANAPLVLESAGIEARDEILIELSPSDASAAAGMLPTISAVEVIHEQ